MTTTQLDVTKIPPALKHATIFNYFDELKPGEHFILKNDHDPKPLYYELQGKRGLVFTWEYIEKGPEWYIIKIGKNAVLEKEEETVGSIAAKDLRKAEVFKEKGIDFCCGGRKTLQQACEAAGISEEELRQALEAVDKAPVTPSQDYNKWELDFLADYIVNTHHRYVKESVDNIYAMAVKVTGRHGNQHPELKEVAERIRPFLQELLHHTEKEEQILFPIIKASVAKKRDQSIELKTPPGFVQQPIAVMQLEHENAGEDLSFFRKVTNNYALPDGACNSYRYLYEKMQEFENDLHQHIHLENNILFPKAIKLDEELAGV
ncbi:MAG: iron-sulfur cluster repair di-iron protein [Niabella sp.]